MHQLALIHGADLIPLVDDPVLRDGIDPDGSNVVFRRTVLGSDRIQVVLLLKMTGSAEPREETIILRMDDYLRIGRPVRFDTEHGRVS